MLQGKPDGRCDRVAASPSRFNKLAVIPAQAGIQ
jgi:hypothetical protein